MNEDAGSSDSWRWFLFQDRSLLLGLNFLLAHVRVLVGFGQVGFLLAVFLAGRCARLDLLGDLGRLLLRLALRLQERRDEAEDEEALDREGDDESHHAARGVSPADAGEEGEEGENQSGEGGEQENDVVEDAD